MRAGHPYWNMVSHDIACLRAAIDILSSNEAYLFIRHRAPKELRFSSYNIGSEATLACEKRLQHLQEMISEEAAPWFELQPAKSHGIDDRTMVERRYG